MKTLKSSLLLCATLSIGTAFAADDIDMEAFEASSQALRSADAKAEARRAAVAALSPRLQKIPLGERAGAHIAAAGACAIDVPIDDLNKLSSLAVAEAVIGKPLAQVPYEAKAILKATSDAIRTPEAAAAATKRQQRAKKLAQSERDWVSRIRVEVKKINPKGEPSDCRYLRGQIDDLLENAERDNSLNKAELVLFAVQELQGQRKQSAR
ncbi:hypothetical protein ACVCNH_11475 [Achromobacter anxifer]